MTMKKGLAPKTIQALTEAATPGMWSHRHGLHLFISPAGTASWAFRFTARGGRRRLMMLEPVTEISAPVLKILEARAAALRLQVKAGNDPMAERDGQRKPPETARRKLETFEEAALTYIAEQSPSWKSAKHGLQWAATLAEYVYPLIGNKSPLEITTQDIWDVLHQKHKSNGKPIIETVTETASRVRMRCEAVIQHVYDLSPETEGRPNPARLTGTLSKKFGLLKKGERHFVAMAYSDVPTFVAELQVKPDYSAKALMLTILCATRTNETLQATWDEINLEAGIWSIPESRMKAGKPHNIPLSNAAIALLETLPRIDGNPYLFPGAREKKPLSNMSMLMMLRGMRENENLTVHGFRSAFRDFSGEETLHPDLIAEMALAHTIKDATVKAYRRGNALDRRRQLMEQWADYIYLNKPEYISKWQKYIP